ncbi:MAG: DegQ family serine endoprotease [Nitrospirae bacterium]|nr:DegQ family serine endoprotease [Nitrospirota bacterium]
MRPEGRGSRRVGHRALVGALVSLISFGAFTSCKDAGFQKDFWPKFLKRDGQAERPSYLPKSEARAESPSSGSAAALTLPDFVKLAEALDPCVVNISSTTTAKGGRKQFRFQVPENDPFHDFMERYFNMPDMPPEQQKSQSLGSGIIISEEGYILTNNHVVDGADKIRVRRSDNEKEVEAMVKGTDPKTDIALLKIEGNGYSVCPLGDSTGMKVGEWVMAIGNPFGFSHTVTVGVVSALGRHNLDLSGSAPTYQNFIQTDAAINPGNSGGPLINTHGEVVGLNTAIYTRSGGSMGIGFAIPINMAKQVIPQLREKGKVVRAWLGVLIQRVTPEIAESLGLDRPEGALVSKVMDGSPAAKAGIQRQDVIVEFEHDRIKEWNELPNRVAMMEVGKSVSVRVVRNKREKDFQVKLAELPDAAPVAAPEEGKPESMLGLQVEQITPESAQEYGLEAEESGVGVLEVEPGSVADEAGLRKGDVIVEVGRRDIKTVSDLKRAFDEAQKSGKPALVLVRRGEATLYLTLEARKKK